MLLNNTLNNMDSKTMINNGKQQDPRVGVCNSKGVGNGLVVYQGPRGGYYFLPKNGGCRRYINQSIVFDATE